MRTLNHKQAAAQWGEDLLPRFSVVERGDHAELRMEKWGVQAKVKVSPKFFEPSETDYRDNAIKYAYATFLSASSGVSYGDFKEYSPEAPPAPHELSTEDLKQSLPAEPADDAELEHTALAPPNLQELNVHDAKDIVAEIESPEVLVTLKHQERDGKNRKTVLEAIDAALDGFAE